MKEPARRAGHPIATVTPVAGAQQIFPNTGGVDSQYPRLHPWTVNPVNLCTVPIAQSSELSEKPNN